MPADPAFPGRPSHPDFYRLSRAVIANDRVEEADNPGEAFRDLVAKHVDLDSLAYMAVQRVAIFTQRGNTPPEDIAALAWIDGFMAACSADDIATVFDGQRRGGS